MKTAMGMEKAKVWLSGDLGTKLATRLLRGLALGALLVAATGLYFSMNQGEAGSPLSSGQYPGYCEIDGRCYDPPLLGVTATIADPLAGDRFNALPDPALVAGGPLASEQGACYPLYPELSPCPSEFIAVVPAIADRYNRGLFDWVLPEDLKPVKAGSRFASEQSQCYPEDVVLGWCYGFAATPNPTLTTGTSISGVQFEEWPEVSFDSYTYYRFMVEQGKVGKGLSTAKVYAEIDDVEAMVIYGYPSSIFHALNQGKAVSRLSSEQLQLIDDLEIMGMPWRIDDGGKVVVVEELQESVAATVIHPYDRSLDDEFMSDAPFFHSLNQGKVARPPSINGIRCYSEDNC